VLYNQNVAAPRRGTAPKVSILLERFHVKLWNISIDHTVIDGKNSYEMRIAEATSSQTTLFSTADLINVCDYIYAMLEPHDA